MKSIRYAVILLAALPVLVPLASFAQDKPYSNMEILKEKIRADKKLLIASNLALSETAAKGFWPVYDRFAKDMEQLLDRMKKLVEDYAENYRTMTDETAKGLLDRWAELEAERPRLMKNYLPAFRKALPDAKVMRYYQIENKAFALLNYKLASRIPPVELGGKEAPVGSITKF